jgi:nuclear transcription factor Y gamma
MISAEAPVLFAKAAEMFITELSLRAWIHTEDNKRRTLQRNDIAMAITKYDQFDFLIDIVPRDELTKPPSSKRSNSNNAGLNLTDLATGAQIPADQLQYVVQSPFQSPGVPGQIQVIQTAQGLQLVTPQGAFPGGQQLLQLQVPSNAGGDTGGPTTNLNLQYQIVGPNGEVSQVPLNQLHQLMKIPGQQGIGNQQILIQTPGNPSSFQLAPQGSQPFIGQPSQESSSDPTVEEQD